jgi:hypothetical protein
MLRLLRIAVAVALAVPPLAAVAQDVVPPPVTHYPLDEGAGSTAADIAGGTTARVGGGLWVKQGDRAALDLDGLWNVVDCGDPPRAHLADGSLTFSVWLRTHSRAQQYVLTHYGWSLYLDAGGRPHFETRAGTNAAWEDLPGSQPVPLNEWVQVACAYDEPSQQSRLYVNGSRQASGERPPGFGGVYRSKLVLGGWTGAHYFSGLLGDTRIWDAALTDAQVQALYEQTRELYPPDLASPPRRLSIRQHRFTADSVLAIDLAFRNLAAPLATAGATVELLPAGQDQPVATQAALLSPEGRAEVIFSTAALPPGRYEVRARVTSDGQPVVGTAISADWPKPETLPWWVGSKEGAADTLMAPWTPVEAACSGGEATLRCWGREYRFARSGLPEGVTTAGADVLAGPVRLVGQTDQGALEWRGAQLALTRQSATAASLETRDTAGGVDLTGTLTLEYDGMLRVDLRLTSQVATRLDRLALEIPLKTRHARYWYYYPDRSGPWEAHRPGLLPEGGVATPFNPALWLGDEERGLQWFAESDEGWLPADAARAVEIAPQGEATVLRLNLIGRPVVLDPASSNLTVGNGQAVERLDYTWGLMATPIKPRGQDAWDLRSTTLFADVYRALEPGPDGRNALDVMQARGVRSLSLMDWTDILCWNRATDPEKLRKFVEECHKRGIQVLVYFGFQLSDAAPEFDLCLEDAANWYEARPYSYDFGLDNYPPKPVQTVYRVCHGSLWQDFVVAGAARLMDEYDLDGIYMDGTTLPLACHNTHHGCGYRDGQGAWRPTYPVFASRRMARRLYTALRGRKPEAQLNLHNSAFMVGPSIGWATSLWDGEHLSGDPGAFLTDRLPLDTFRAEFMGHNWGVAQEFLEYSLPGDFRAKWGLTLLHDVPTRPYGAEVQLPYAAAIWSAMDRFGREQATWHPYWANADLVTAEPAEVYVSLYRRPTNGVLLVADNLGRSRAHVSLRLEPEKLGLTGALSARDALTGEPIAARDRTLTMDLDSLAWKLVEVSSED